MGPPTDAYRLLKDAPHTRRRAGLIVRVPIGGKSFPATATRGQRNSGQTTTKIQRPMRCWIFSVTVNI